MSKAIKSPGLLMSEEGMYEEFFTICDLFSDYFDVTNWLSTRIKGTSYIDHDVVACTVEKSDFKHKYLCYIQKIKSINYYIFTIIREDDFSVVRVVTLYYYHPKNMQGMLRSIFHEFEPQSSMKRFPWKDVSDEQWERMLKEGRI